MYSVVGSLAVEGYELQDVEVPMTRLDIPDGKWEEIEGIVQYFSNLPVQPYSWQPGGGLLRERLRRIDALFYNRAKDTWFILDWKYGRQHTPNYFTQVLRYALMWSLTRQGIGSIVASGYYSILTQSIYVETKLGPFLSVDLEGFQVDAAYGRGILPIIDRINVTLFGTPYNVRILPFDLYLGTFRWKQLQKEKDLLWRHPGSKAKGPIEASAGDSLSTPSVFSEATLGSFRGLVQSAARMSPFPHEPTEAVIPTPQQPFEQPGTELLSNELAMRRATLSSSNFVDGAGFIVRAIELLKKQQGTEKIGEVALVPLQEAKPELGAPTNAEGVKQGGTGVLLQDCKPESTKLQGENQAEQGIEAKEEKKDEVNSLEKEGARVLAMIKEGSTQAVTYEMGSKLRNSASEQIRAMDDLLTKYQLLNEAIGVEPEMMLGDEQGLFVQEIVESFFRGTTLGEKMWKYLRSRIKASALSGVDSRIWLYLMLVSMHLHEKNKLPEHIKLKWSI
jgi:hypothetical protein